MQEFAFELNLCEYLENHRRGIISRQLGASIHGGGANRVMDIVHVSPGPAFEKRLSLGSSTIPPEAIKVPVSTGKWQPVSEVFDKHPEHTNRIVKQAVKAGFFEFTRKDKQPVIRQVTDYPVWYDTLTGIENKPNLNDPGNLSLQLDKDLALQLFDEIIVATTSYVTKAHLHRLPDEIGIWRFDPETSSLTVIRDPTQLNVQATGYDITETTPTRVDIKPVSQTEKHHKRRRIAELAFGKGWRIADLPACAHMEPSESGLPMCTYYDRVVNPNRACSPSCEGFKSGDKPTIDTAHLREQNTEWEKEPTGFAREQSSLDIF
ncbi:MAG: DUF5787 family protein [Halobacteriaceae archaeon]